MIAPGGRAGSAGCLVGAFVASLVVSLSMLVFEPSRAAARPSGPSGQGAAQQLQSAARALDSADYARANGVARSVLSMPGLELIDRAEAHRIGGLALFFMQQLQASEDELLRYLRLEPNAHLDPGRYPPEAIVFFEDVRSRHTAELYRPVERSRTVREWSKNLFPPWGQFANGQRAKGWIIGTGELALLAAHLSSFVVLRRWCDQGGTGVCVSGSESRRSEARVLRAVNLLSGVAAISLYVYGVADGFRGHRRLSNREKQRRMSVGVSTTAGGAAVTMGLRF